MVHDLIVIGGGPGGYGVGFRAAARGLDVAIVEEDEVGGTCLNRGCIPSKATLYVAEVLEQVHRADILGLDVTCNGIKGEQLDAFRNMVMDRMRNGLRSLVNERSTFYAGRGRIVEGSAELKQVEVTGEDGTTTTLESRNVVLATGSKPRTLPGVEIDGEVVQTSDQALWFTEAPHRAVIIGAGAIGMEFASMWAPMGTDVTVVEALDRVLPLEDPDCSKAIERAYRKRGIEVLTSATVKKVETGNGSASVVVDSRHNEMEIEADVVLVAIGRGPNTVDTGAEELGILDDRGYVQTDEYGRTAVKGIWAVGDVRPTLALAHAAFAEGFVVGDLLAKVDNVQPVDHIQTPRVTYCHPEVASVGLTEPDARERYGDDGITTTTYSLTANAKTLIAGSEGFVKVIARTGEFGETVGVHIVGPHSTDLIGEAAVVTDWGALPSEVGAITHAHPTVYEAMGEAFLAASGTPFHGH